MDYEALKEQWSEVEDRDGVRLSWNVFPSTRMVCHVDMGPLSPRDADTQALGGVPTGGSHWRALYSLEREAGYSSASVRACDM